MCVKLVIYKSNRFLLDTGNGLVQSDTSYKANTVNASAVASLTLLVSANVRGKESFTDREILT